MSDSANLMGMELKAAREYVLAHVTTLKTTQLELKKTTEDLSLWESRVRLAAERNRADLQSAAQAKVDELREKAGKLTSEERQLTQDIARMKIQLKAIEHEGTYTVDAELLNAQMEQIVGENAGTAEEFRKTEADRALEELKRKLDPNYVPKSAPQAETAEPAAGRNPSPEQPEEEKSTPDSETSESRDTAEDDATGERP